MAMRPLVIVSGRPDSNRGPLQPHCSALPDCATPRFAMDIIAEAKQFAK